MTTVQPYNYQNVFSKSNCLTTKKKPIIIYDKNAV